jgi:hypothetical protein
VAAEVLCLVPVALAVAGGELSIPVAVALGGFGLFSIGLPSGSGPVVATGLGTTARATARTQPAGTARRGMGSVIGGTATASLVAADSSWWLRRQPEVDRRVYGTIGRRVVAAWLIGAAMAAAASNLAGAVEWSIWLLPVAVAAAGALVAAAGYAIGRGRGRGPSSEVSRREARVAAAQEWDPLRR